VTFIQNYSINQRTQFQIKIETAARISNTFDYKIKNVSFV